MFLAFQIAWFVRTHFRVFRLARAKPHGSRESRTALFLLLSGFQSIVRRLILLLFWTCWLRASDRSSNAVQVIATILCVASILLQGRSSLLSLFLLILIPYFAADIATKAHRFWHALRDRNILTDEMISLLIRTAVFTLYLFASTLWAHLVFQGHKIQTDFYRLATAWIWSLHGFEWGLFQICYLRPVSYL